MPFIFLSNFSFVNAIRKKLIFFSIGLFFIFSSSAQKITYSNIDNDDIDNTTFQIIGIMDEEILVYQISDKKHLIVRYNQEMQNIGQVYLSFLPEKTDRIQFVKSKNELVVFFQFIKENTVFCKKAIYDKIENTFKNIATVDSINKKSIGNNNFYSVSISENKKTYLLYFIKTEKDTSFINTAIFDNQFNKVKQQQHRIHRENKNQLLTNLLVDNVGNYFFAIQSKSVSANRFNKINLIICQIDQDSAVNILCDTKTNMFQNILLKIDNLNKRCLVNAFYLNNQEEMVAGLYTCVFSWQDVYHPQHRFNPFSDDFKSAVKTSRQGSFDNLVPRDIIVKNSGGFSIIAEDCYTETQNLNNNWDRNYRNTFLGSGMYDFNNPYYFSNRYFDNSSNIARIKYYCNDILVMSLDSNLVVDWKSSIRKKQNSEQSEKYLSYGYLNTGMEISFLYVEKENQRYMLSHNGISANGISSQYPAIRCYEENYQFIPRYGKQVAWNQIVIPYTYLNKIGFANITF